MDVAQLEQRLSGKIMILDGAVGTALQEQGMPVDVRPEAWASAHPDILRPIQAAYFAAGADLIYSFTFIT